MISGISIRDLEIFGHGLFQDILTLMNVLDTDELTRKDAERYRDLLLKNRGQGSKPVPRKPCKGCKDKKK